MTESTGRTTIEKALVLKEARSKSGTDQRTVSLEEWSRGSSGSFSSGFQPSHETHDIEIPKSGLEREFLRRDAAAEPATKADYILPGKVGDGASSQFDMLRTKILGEMQEKGWRSLGITSPMARSGKTVIAVNLSISIARGIHKDIVLADLDLRHPSIAGYLGIDNSPDLSDFLEGRIEFMEPLVNPGIPRLLILPNRTSHSNSSDMMVSPAMTALPQRLQAMANVQLVIYDLPPALPTDDTLAFLPHVDCILVVVAEGVTTKQELDATRKLLRKHNVLGYVLNKPA